MEPLTDTLGINEAKSSEHMLVNNDKMENITLEPRNKITMIGADADSLQPNLYSELTARVCFEEVLQSKPYYQDLDH